MALSHDEQRRLEQLEALLAQDDPQLAHTLRGTQPGPVTGKRAAAAGAGFLAGIGLLIAGMQWHWTICVLGFLVMLGSAAWLTSRGPHDDLDDLVEDDDSPLATTSTGGREGPRRPTGTDFMDKLEERWRRRHDEGR